ncbi:MAG: DUF3830 family protein [Ignavibacteriae bacterium]|nr:DUF3830 family protein [Ignavibacteriota bacterium]
MKIGFKIKTKNSTEIRFTYYLTDAPVSSEAFNNILPFKRNFLHAMVSGQEIWFNNLPPVDIIQENASVFTKPGEVVLGPAKPARVKTANCFGIYYGEGKGLDAANIFAKVVDEDFEKLKQLGEAIRMYGTQELEILSYEE